MRNVKASPTFPLLRLRKRVSGSIIASLMLTCIVPAQAQSPRTKIEALGLESMSVGRVTTLFAQNDRARAKQLGELSGAAVAFFERELGVSFEEDSRFSDRSSGFRHTAPVCRTASLVFSGRGTDSRTGFAQ
jgi:hypothetical protein